MTLKQRYDIWVYASANSVTVTGDVSGTYWAGMMVKLWQGDVAKYFLIESVVYSSPSTTITLNGYGVYSLTNAVITGHIDTTEAAPKGFPAISIVTSPEDTDYFGLVSQPASRLLKGITWSSLKTALNGLYSALGHTHDIFSGYDVLVYQSGGLTIAENGWTHAIIDSGTTGPTVNTRVLNAAIAACPVDGSLYIGSGTYYLLASTSCTAGPAGYLTYNVALPISKNMHIKGAGMGATILMLAASQHYTDHPALLMYLYHPYSDGGFGVAYTAFSLEGMTFDGNVSSQTVWHYDGAGLLLMGSMRYNGVFRDLEFRNSADSGIYSGNHGAGWEVDGFFNNIYSHDNAEFDQFDNPENCVLNGWISENNGNAFNHIGLIIDTMDTGRRSLTASNIDIRKGLLFLFGPAGCEPNPDTAIQISNLNIDNSEISCNGVHIEDFGNVEITGGRIRVNSTTNYAIYLQHASNIDISDVVISGLRGIVSASSTVNSITVRDCRIETASHIMIMQSGDVYNFHNCYLSTEDNAAYLIAAALGRTVNLYSCVGGSNGYGQIAATGTINHSGTSNLGLEAFGYVDSLANGGTIAHGLKVTPRFVSVGPTVAGTIVSYTVDATNITVTFTGVTTTQKVYWHARY